MDDKTAKCVVFEEVLPFSRHIGEERKAERSLTSGGFFLAGINNHGFLIVARRNSAGNNPQEPSSGSPISEDGFLGLGILVLCRPLYKGLYEGSLSLLSWTLTCVACWLGQIRRSRVLGVLEEFK